MNNDPQVQQIFTTFEQLRAAGNDGPRTRKLLDALFRNVHNLKATASANGLDSLANAAHEFENVLHSLRTSQHSFDGEIPSELWNSLKQEQKHTLQQALSEGAKLFVLQASFDVTDFDRQFQALKERLTKDGEVISTWPSTDKERPGKVNFKILYARSGAVVATEAQDQLPILEPAFEKLRAELANFRSAENDGALQQALRAGQAAAAATGKEVDFELHGEDLLLDSSLSDKLATPLLHLVRNAVDHGIEANGKIVIEAIRDGDQITIKVKDNGRGIDPATIPLIFRPGFSTAGELSTLSGRGVGLDAVQTAIEELGGSITVHSELGKGSCFEIRLHLR